MSLTSIGKITNAFKGVNKLTEVDTIARTLDGMSAESIVGIATKQGRSADVIARVLAAHQFDANTIASSMAMHGFGENVTREALTSLDYFDGRVIKTAVDTTTFTAAVDATGEAAQTMGGKIKGAAKGLKGWWSGLSSGMKAGLIIGAITLVTAGVIKAVDAVTESTDEAIENLSTKASEIKGNNEQIESLNGQLKSVRDRVAELQSMGSLTITEENELDDLREQSRELQNQIALLKERNKEAQASIYSSSKSIWDNFKDDNWLDLWNSSYKKRAGKSKDGFWSKLWSGILSLKPYRRDTETPMTGKENRIFKDQVEQTRLMSGAEWVNWALPQLKTIRDKLSNMTDGSSKEYAL